MKKAALLFGLMLAATTIFAQKPKNMKQLRDSVFTEMKLSDENKQKMHDAIGESSRAQKAIKDDATLTDEQKKEKVTAVRKEMSAKEKAIMTPEQAQMWKEFSKSLRKPKQ